MGRNRRNGNLYSLSVIIGDIGFLFGGVCGLDCSVAAEAASSRLSGRRVAVGINGIRTVTGGRIPCGIGGVRLGALLFGTRLPHGCRKSIPGALFTSSALTRIGSAD